MPKGEYRHSNESLTMSTATASKVAAEELAAIPDDGYQHELLEGVVRRMTPASFRLSTLALRIGARIAANVEPRNLGEVLHADGGSILARDPDTVLVPEVAFVRAALVPPREVPYRFAALPPNLVIEVVSPCDRITNVNDKVARYSAAGVPLVWVFHSRDTPVIVHGPGQPMRTLDGEEIISGFTLPLDQIF